MEHIKFSQLPSVVDTSVGSKVIIKDSVFNGVGDKKKASYSGDRYSLCEIMGNGGVLNSISLKVVKSSGYNPFAVGSLIVRPLSNVINRGRQFTSELAKPITSLFKNGGELNPDSKDVKNYFAHNSGSAGGVLVGKRHSDGGIKAVNNSTGQPLEMEGGEVVITRDAVSDPTLREFEGKKMTNREILSSINQSGGGVAFADGGNLPERMPCNCSGKQYMYGGKMMSDYEIVRKINNGYGSSDEIKKGMQIEEMEHGDTLKMLRNGEISYENAIRSIVTEHLSENPNYYRDYGLQKK